MKVNNKKLTPTKESKKLSSSEEVTRGQWANKTEFLLSCLGYAIGIGNVWRFPYLCYRNGGGAFLIPYLLMLAFCGIPLFYMESCLGQFSSSSCLTIFKICPLLKGCGYATVIVNIITTLYFNVIVSLPFVFLYNCLQANLPWDDCNNPWNTDKCLELDGSSSHLTEFMLSKNDSSYEKRRTPADEFFHFKVLNISDSINEVGGIVPQLLIANLLSWIVVYFCISKGVKSVGKVVYFTATFPFIILFVLFIRGITLPGAMDGIYFYIYPDWNRLWNFKTWADAALQIFFSLGPGWGGIINMASFNPFHNNVKSDSIVVPIVNCGTSIFAGFVVFSVLGFMSHKTGIPVSTVATSGPGLAFITYPEAISMLPLPHLWAIAFFVMLYLLGIDTLFVQTEAIITSIMDEHPRLRKHKTLITFLSICIFFVSSLVFVSRAGMYYIQLIDWYCASVSIILICLMEIIIVGWIYGIDNFIRDIKFMMDIKMGFWWPFCWKYLTSVILVIIFMTTIFFNTEVTYNGKAYPFWSIILGWSSCLVSMVCIPGYAIYLISRTPGNFIQRIRTNLKSTEDWGPSDVGNRKEWKTLITMKETNNINLNNK
ncbi:sodium- and chloride-dependent glycine transporter 1-like isoform X2 [Chrysoperla carnea]|uniref:sodium- and chloride-dependent glycine transporter 1-like isoform X2 n=1 Tax=Chrysoperla carnea TaxID=189513 RepID=UPI001D0675C9|nr:sodium- and chloride-dependent glycine transporter 1-like isoform X2 [Chrysoperla carnea]